jgi:hypothetical protein
MTGLVVGFIGKRRLSLEIPADDRAMPVDPKRLEAVFLAAVEADDPAARDTILDRECGTDH